jgi:uncharacterized protein YjbI with pentapeptide repeats
MADEWQVSILQQGAEAWNSWREQNREVGHERGLDLTWANLYGGVHLSGVNLSSADLYSAALYDADLSNANFYSARLTAANLSGANLSGADLSRTQLNTTELPKANLSNANLTEAVVFEAYLDEANLSGANLSGADLHEAILTGADLTGADLSRANLRDADLRRSTLVQTNLERATLGGCRIYGISAWGLNLEGAQQQNLNISEDDEPAITVDNLEVAQFIYLLLNNERIRQVIDTITSKVVLILGRFTSERIVVLEAIRDALRQHDYLPVLFDFEKPTSRDLTETISTLAHMARFIIADISEAKSIPQELQAIVPDLPSVPVQPLLLASDYEYGMFEHFKRYPWVLEVYCYENPHEVLTSLEAKIISPAEAKARELSR